LVLLVTAAQKAAAVDERLGKIDADASDS